MITREFNLYLHAGHSIPLVINVNQYDQGEQWLFTLFNADGTQYTPSSGAIVGIKSDNLGIINSGTVDSQGRVVINETQQMTAAVGKAVFELLIDDQTHGTANFVVLVEEKPGNNADLSETDISMIEEAIEAASSIKPYGSPLVASTVAGMTDHDKVYVYVGSETGYTSGNWYYWDGSAWTSGGVYNSVAVQTDTTLTLSGVAADSKKVGDEISDLKSQIAQLEAIPYAVKLAMDTLFQNMAFKNSDVYTDEIAVVHNWATSVNLLSISVVFNQGTNAIYETDSLDSLRRYLTVTASYDDGTSSVVSGYTLSGTLSEGTSTITVLYGGKTTTFNVVVSPEWGSDYTWLYKASDNALLSARTDLVTPQIGTGCTETLVDGLLHLFVPLNSAEIIRYRLVQDTNTNAKLTAKVKFGSIGYAQYGTGLRLQVSNGTNGGQIFEHCDRDGSNCYFGTYEGTVYTNQLAFDLNTWYIISVERNNGKQIVTVDGTEILNSSTLSENWCTSNAIFAQNAQNSPADFNVDIEWITYKNND